MRDALVQNVVKTDISVETPMQSHESSKMVAEPPFRFTGKVSIEIAQEFECRARLEKQRESQEASESELLVKMEPLKSVHENWILD